MLKIQHEIKYDGHDYLSKVNRLLLSFLNKLINAVLEQGTKTIDYSVLGKCASDTLNVSFG